ncbi:MAG: RraA family protein, partial [Comamonadaceae bacterium]
ATWGENHALRCRQRGVEGMLTDGSVRDAGAIDRGAFPVFCRALSPVKSLWDLETASIGEAVNIDGVAVNPGDAIFADETGILVIPAGSLVEIAERAHRIKTAEQARQDGLRQPG